MINEISTLNITKIDNSDQFGEKLNGENLNYNFIKRKRLKRMLERIANRHHKMTLKKALEESFDVNEKLLIEIKKLKEEKKFLQDFIKKVFNIEDNKINEESSTTLTETENVM